MTDPNRQPDFMEIEHLVQVLGKLGMLLARFDESARASWLSDRLSILEETTTPLEEKVNAVQERHQVVLGMGGLMDLHLTASSPKETEDANAELDRLAGQLFELTR
jgi:hypothetical protein